MQEINPKKKLLIATDSFLPRWDGISRVLKEILPFLARKYDLTLMVPNFPGKKHDFPGVKLVKFPLMNFKIGDYTPPKPSIKKIKQLIKESDIVWGQTIGPIGAVSMYYAKKYNKPLLAYIHSVEWELFSKSLKRFQRTVSVSIKLMVTSLYNKCDLLLVPSETTKQVLQQRGIKANKEVVHLGVDVDRFKPEDKEKAKKKIGISEDKIVIGYLGRFGREKDLATLYKAFKSLNAEFKEIKLLLVGGEKAPLEEFCKSFENIKVVSSTDTPEIYYQAMDIYVLPSLTETTSLTTLEAMSSALPVVCTPVGHIPNYVEHKVNGFIFPQQSAERLTIILRMLIKDEKLRERLGVKARKTVLTKYSWKKTAEELQEAIRRFG
ncbi:glycosyltransferase family 4 protein [Thermoproteota archaeon]